MHFKTSHEAVQPFIPYETWFASSLNANSITQSLAPCTHIRQVQCGDKCRQDLHKRPLHSCTSTQFNRVFLSVDMKPDCFDAGLRTNTRETVFRYHGNPAKYTEITPTLHSKKYKPRIYLQICVDNKVLCVIHSLHWIILLYFLLLCNLVPDLCVDPQGPGQGEAGSGAGNPAAQWAAHGVEDALQLGHFLQARGAECVLAVEDTRNPVSAWVLVTAYNALELFNGEHGDFSRGGSQEMRSPVPSPDRGLRHDKKKV